MENKQEDLIKKITSLKNSAEVSKQASNSLVIKFYKRITDFDYLATLMMAQSLIEDDEKVYIKDIAKKLNLSIEEAGNKARSLRDKNLITWTHDGNGEEGTYIQVTQRGKNLLLEQYNEIEYFHKVVIEKFGKERFTALFKELMELETILHGNEKGDEKKNE